MKSLPKAFNNCKCRCHVIPGITHVSPCCGPARERELEAYWNRQLTDEEIEVLNSNPFFLSKPQEGE